MNPRDIFTYSYKALAERRLRSSLTILMVIIGVTLITALNGMNSGFSNFINEQLGLLAPNVLIISPTRELERRFGPPPTSSIVFTDLTVRTLASIQGVDEVVPNFRGSVRLLSAGKVQDEVTLTGIDPSKLKLINPSMELERGEMLKSNDPAGALLGWRIAHPEGEATPFADVGWTIRMSALVVEGEGRQQYSRERIKNVIVRGILKETGNIVQDNTIFITLKAADAFLRKGGRYDGIFVVTKGVEWNDLVEEAIKRTYRESVSVFSPRAIIRTIENVTAGFRAFFLGIAGVSLLVGAVGIITTLFTSVMERTREIGTLKALGFRNLHVLLIFLTESVTIGIIGGMLGILAGIGGGFIMNRILAEIMEVSFTPVFLPNDLLSAWLLAVGASTVAGLYPAWRAAKVDPIVALRKE